MSSESEKPAEETETNEDELDDAAKKKNKSQKKNVH